MYFATVFTNEKLMEDSVISVGAFWDQEGVCVGFEEHYGA